jgi:hypothetical protein
VNRGRGSFFVSQSGVIARTKTAHLLPGQSTADVVGVGNFKATCPKYETVVGTGVDTGIGRLGFVEKFGRFAGAFIYNDTSIPIDAEVQAICSDVVYDVSAARVARADSRALRSFKAREAVQRAVK